MLDAKGLTGIHKVPSGSVECLHIQTMNLSSTIASQNTICKGKKPKIKGIKTHTKNFFSDKVPRYIVLDTDRSFTGV